MDHCHIIIAWDLTFSATKEDLAQPGWIYFALNLKIHLFFLSLSIKWEKTGSWGGCSLCLLKQHICHCHPEKPFLTLTNESCVREQQEAKAVEATDEAFSVCQEGRQSCFWTILHNSWLADNWGSASFTKHFPLHKFHTIHKLMDVLYKKEGSEGKRLLVQVDDQNKTT